MLQIVDIARSADGTPLYRYPVKVAFSTPDPFLHLTGDTAFHPGQSINAGGYSVITARDGTFTLSLPWPSESSPSPLTVTVTLPDGGQYSGIVPEGAEGPLLFADLVYWYAWSSPRGPGQWPQPNTTQMFGMLFIGGSAGPPAAAPTPTGDDGMFGMFLL